MAIFKCKMCGGTIEFEPGASVGECSYCGTRQTLPRLDDERRANLYDRANHFRRNNEFDKAAGIYEQILTEDTADAEAYWSLVLCRYGIEYVEDPATKKRVPTVNRAQFTSIFDDDNYKSAIQYADVSQRAIYEEEGNAINEIQKGILAISQKEEPFDVFICYKETDANGRRTPDSVLANDLYHQLTQEGFKVFFSRITLEDKLGTAYEPYIFAALNSAKVMVALGTKPEYFNAVWVKNEWSRYLALVKQSGGKKILIPAYKDMDPYDLPEEFSHLQAQDMSKLGFMQDLIRGIKKIVKTDEPKPAAVKETVTVQSESGNLTAILDRGFLALEDGEWMKADGFFEQALNFDAKNARAYLGKLMAEYHVRKPEELKKAEQLFDQNPNYQKIFRFGDESLKAEMALTIESINARLETKRLTKIYNKAAETMNAAKSEKDYKTAAEMFATIPGFMNANERAAKCIEKAEIVRKDAIYNLGISKMSGENIGNYEDAIKAFQSISGWKDTEYQVSVCQRNIEEIKKNEEEKLKIEKDRRVENYKKQIEKEKQKKKIRKIVAIAALFITVCIAFAIVLTKIIIPTLQYNTAVNLYEDCQYEEAIALFMSLNDFNDSEEQIKQCQDAISNEKYNTAIYLKEKGEYEKAIPIFAELNDYKNSKDCILSCKYKIAKEKEHQGDIAQAAILFGGLGSYNKSREQSFKLWNKIANRQCISANCGHSIGLKTDGTVVATGNNDHGQCNISSWSDIIAISAGFGFSLGLKANGTVVATNFIKSEYVDYEGQCNVSEWKDIVAISAGSNHSLALRSDGTVVAVGNNDFGQCNTTDWTDIIAISAGHNHSLGLKLDGTVIAVGDNHHCQCDVDNWTNIVAISAGERHSIGLKSNGMVVATKYSGNIYVGESEVIDWKDIANVSADGGSTCSIGLKKNGTLVAVGENFYGECNVAEWTNIVAVSAGCNHSLGLMADGTVIATGDNRDGECEVSEWKNIKLPYRNN